MRGLADAMGMPVASRRMRQRWGKWLLLVVFLWVIQLVWIHQRLGRPSWSEYWRMRGIYRPGIQTVDATGGSVLPGYVFHPLSPNGAPWAFVLAAGVYAGAATLLIWCAVRLRERYGKRAARSLRRAIA